MLRQKDEYAYNTIDLNNPVRVVRALEIAESGEQRKNGKGKTDPKYNCLLFVLQRNREQLYRMIDDRVDKMIQQGLVDEVSRIVNEYGICDTSAFSAIGYKEIIEFLQEKCTLAQATEKIKLNTRHYAKRQITYFKRMNVQRFVDVEGLSATEIAKIIFDECAQMGLE